MTTLPTKIEVKGNTIEVQVPASYYIRSSIMEANASAPLAASAAALGVCYPKLQRAVPWNDKPIAYGRRVVEYLSEQGWLLADIRAAGDLCWVHLVQSMPDWKEVQDKATFSEPEEEASIE
jgi:hypothetical protein